MDKNILYILIAVFLFMSIALVWLGVKAFRDMGNRKKYWRQRRERLEHGQ